jgi:hypothetical protein
MSHGKELRYMAQQLAEGIEAGEYKRLNLRALCGLRALAIQLEELSAVVCALEKASPSRKRWWRIF